MTVNTIWRNTVHHGVFPVMPNLVMDGVGTEALKLEHLVKSVFSAVFRHPQCIPTKLKFGMKEYTMGSLSDATLGVWCTSL